MEFPNITWVRDRVTTTKPVDKERYGISPLGSIDITLPQTVKLC
jgi:hypothetical protein